MACARALVLVCLAQAAFGADPPDPRQGERHDGRAWQPDPRDRWLLAPRVLLAPLRFLLRAVAVPARAGVEFEQRNQALARLAAAFTSEDGKIGLRPLFTYASSFLATGGLYFFYERKVGFGLTLAFGSDALFYARARVRPLDLGKRLSASFDTTFDRRPDRIFAGIDGQGAPLSRYASDVIDVRAQVAGRLHRTVHLRGGLLFGLRRYGEGVTVAGDSPIGEVYCVRWDGVCIPGLVDPLEVPGFRQGTQFMRGTLGLRFDARDHPLHAASGFLADLEADYSHGVGGDASSYFRLRGMVAVPIDLWQGSHVLVLRVSSQLLLPIGSTPVPFSELPSVGGLDSLPGYLIDQFRGSSTLVGSIEYRWPIWMWMDGMLFADYGGAFGSYYSGIGVNRLHSDLGVGVRVRTAGNFFLRCQLAYGFDDSGVRFYVSGTPTP